jgi:hypothetical protein
MTPLQFFLIGLHALEDISLAHWRPSDAIAMVALHLRRALEAEGPVDAEQAVTCGYVARICYALASRWSRAGLDFRSLCVEAEYNNEVDTKDQ